MPPRAEPPTGSTPHDPAAESPTGKRPAPDATKPAESAPAAGTEDEREPLAPPRLSSDEAATTESAGLGEAVDRTPASGEAPRPDDGGAAKAGLTGAGRETTANTRAAGESSRSGSGVAAQAERLPGEAVERAQASSNPPRPASGEAAKPKPTSTARKPGNPDPTPRPTATRPPTPNPAWAAEDTDAPRPSPLLAAALGLAALGAVALAVAGIVPVSPAAGPGFAAWPWLVLLALAPAVAAVWAFASKHPRLGGGIVLGLAALAPGRLVLDLQFAVNGPLTIRPELYLPDRFLGGSAVGAGFWLLVAGHVLTCVAGLLAWRAHRGHEEPERRRWRLLAPLLAVVAGVGLLTAPVLSDNGFLLARAAFEGPWPALGGYLLLAAALPLAAALALAAPSESTARGALAGLAAGAFAVALPPVLAGLYRSDLHVTWGPVLVLGATAVIGGLAFTPLSENTEYAEKPETDLAGAAKLPGLFWWRLTTGLLGLVTAIAAVIGSLAPQVAVTALNPGAATPVSAAAASPARWFLLTAALVLAVLAAGTLVPKTAPGARPLLGLAWAGIVLAGTAVLNTALTATQAGNLAGFGGTGTTPAFTYDLGAGAAWTFAALVLAALTALAAAGTGVVEREDTGDAAGPGGNVLTPVVAGGVLAVAAFGLPVFSVPGYVAPGLWSNFDTPSWGLLTAAAVVVGASALALRSRPKPAAALLAGAALLVALHAAELPLVGGALGDASPSTGFWVALAAVAALLVAAGMSVAGGRKAP